MKNSIKVLSIIVLMFTSFYYTEKIAAFVQNRTPLKKKIISVREDNRIIPVNAIIDGKYIIPGMNGLEVDVDKSYEKMKSYNVFSESELAFTQVQPEISLENHNDKIILGGNRLKKAVSFVIDDSNIRAIEYLSLKNIPFSFVKNNDYCFYEINIDCQNKSKVKISKMISSENISKEINEIKSGDIIYLMDNLEDKYLNLIINRVNFFNYKISTLHELLSEKNVI